MRGGHRSAAWPRGATFAVRARRRDKGWLLTSHELATSSAKRCRTRLGLAVDLSNPELEVHLEVDKQELFAFSERIPGRGGLPVGVSGRAVCLISGGIDSPVAAYRAMKRGLRCDFVHFSGRPFTGPESIYKAYAQVARLDAFQGGSRLFVVPFGSVQRQLATAGAARLQVIAQRRLMMRAASALAVREGPRLSSPVTLSARSRLRRFATSASSRMRRRCPCSARSSPGTSPRSFARLRTSARTRSRTFRPRTAAPCSPARWPRRGRLRTSRPARTAPRRRRDRGRVAAHGRIGATARRFPAVQPAQTHYAGNMEF